MDLILLWQFVLSQKGYILAGIITLIIFITGYGFGYINSYLHWKKKAFLLVDYELKKENIQLKQQLEDYKIQLDRVIKVDKNTTLKFRQII